MADPRKDLGSAYALLDEQTQGGIVELAKQMLVETLTATKEQLVKGHEIKCRDCGRVRIYDIPIRAPDVLTRLKGFEIIANQLQGNPQTSAKLEVNVTARTMQELEALSMEELAQLAGEAEWEELPVSTPDPS
jgi:hypothetical protein